MVDNEIFQESLKGRYLGDVLIFPEGDPRSIQFDATSREVAEKMLDELKKLDDEADVPVTSDGLHVMKAGELRRAVEEYLGRVG